MAENYTVTKTTPWTYLNEQGQPIKGYKVTIYIQKFKEEHDIYAPSLEPNTVKAAIEKLVSDREAVSKL